MSPLAQVALLVALLTVPVLALLAAVAERLASRGDDRPRRGPTTLRRAEREDDPVVRRLPGPGPARATDWWSRR